MPLFYTHSVNNDETKTGVWHITEDEGFFLEKVPLKREITHHHKRLQHLAGRYLLQCLFPDFPYHLIEIADTRRPFLPNEEYHFSISHCGDYAAVCISKTNRVGVDIESVTPKIELIKKKFLGEDELELVNEFCKPRDIEHRKLLTGLWCVKESLYKWIGEGGVDFKGHLQITKLNDHGDRIVADCKVKHSKEVDLKVELRYFDGECLAVVR